MEDRLYKSKEEDTRLRGRFTAICIFFFLGVGNLLPWHAFITASSYYQNRFCGTSFENSFESYFSMFYTVSQPIGLLVTIFFKRRFTTKALVFYPLLVYFVTFIVTTAFVLISTIPQLALFYLTAFSAFLCGLCAAIMNGGLFGLSGILPAEYTGAIMSGQGFAGTAVSVVNLLIICISTKHTCTNDDDGLSVTNSGDDSCGNKDKTDYGALAYFLVATVSLCSCIFLFLRLLRLEYVRYFMHIHLQEHLISEEQVNPLSFRITDSAQDNSLLASSHQSDISFPQSIESNTTTNKKKTNNNNDDGDDLAFTHNMSSTALEKFPGSIPSEPHRAATETDEVIMLSASEIFRVLRKIYLPATSVLLVFAGTLAVFPSILVLIKSQHECHDAEDSVYGNTLWVPFLFFLLNISDFLGRVAAPILKRKDPRGSVINPTTIFAASIARLVIPLFLCLSNIDNNHLPIVTRNDGITWLLTILLGFTNGCVANIAMMQGPSLVETGADASLAGTIMIFCLSSGLLVGSCLSLLLFYIVIGS